MRAPAPYERNIHPRGTGDSRESGELGRGAGTVVECYSAMTISCIA
jgi:hypothetical protein